MKKYIALLVVGLLLCSSSAMASGWQLDGRGWWYQDINGSYPVNAWKKIDTEWYYFDSDGYMVTGFQNISGKTYYFASSGAMATGWTKVGNDWYEFTADGMMLKNQWSGDYYLGSDGKMLVNTTTPDGYYVDGTGVWVALPGCSYAAAIELINLSNQYRASHGVAVQPINAKSMQIASYRAQELFSKYSASTRPDGSAHETIYQDMGITHRPSSCIYIVKRSSAAAAFSSFEPFSTYLLNTTYALVGAACYNGHYWALIMEQ